MYKALVLYFGALLFKMELVKSNKGGDKLCYEGFCYTKRYESKNRTRWQCSERHGSKCKGAVVKNLAVDVVHSSFAHNHLPNGRKVAATKVKLAMKHQATLSRGRPGQILADALASSK